MKGLDGAMTAVEHRGRNLPPKCKLCRGPCKGGAPVVIMTREEPFSRCEECGGPLGSTGPIGKLTAGRVILKRVILDGGVPFDLTPEGVAAYQEEREQLERELEEEL